MQELTLSPKLVRHRWYHSLFRLWSSSGTLTLNAKAKARDIGKPEGIVEDKHSLKQPLRIASHIPLTVGGNSHGGRPSSDPLESGSFNGKVDGFRVETRSWAG